jgi:hypothetical protein
LKSFHAVDGSHAALDDEVEDLLGCYTILVRCREMLGDKRMTGSISLRAPGYARGIKEVAMPLESLMPALHHSNVRHGDKTPQIKGAFPDPPAMTKSRCIMIPHDSISSVHQPVPAKENDSNTQHLIELFWIE